MFQSRVENADSKSDAFEAVEAWIDSGAYYSQFPADMLRRLGYSLNATPQFRLADGSPKEASIGDVRIRIGRESYSVACVFAEGRRDIWPGETTREAFRLGVDPVNEELIQVIAR
jgi:hypothetical protein